MQPLDDDPGNIRETAFSEMADSPAMRAFMAARPSFCDDCGLADECLGGCKAAAEACYGDIAACDPFLATYQHQAVKPT